MRHHCQLSICLERITKEGETLAGFETRMETIVWGGNKNYRYFESQYHREKNINYKDWKPQVWIPSQSHWPSLLWHNFVASCPYPSPIMQYHHELYKCYPTRMPRDHRKSKILPVTQNWSYPGSLPLIGYVTREKPELPPLSFLSYPIKELKYQPFRVVRIGTWYVKKA